MLHTSTTAKCACVCVCVCMCVCMCACTCVCAQVTGGVLGLANALNELLSSFTFSALILAAINLWLVCALDTRD